MFGWVGWYLSQYRPSTVAPLTRAIFFTIVGFLGLAFWYAAQAYAETAAELAQNVLGVTPGESRILFYLQLEFGVCAIASVLILLVFADAVTRSAPMDPAGSRLRSRLYAQGDQAAGGAERMSRRAVRDP
jgi:hypothetical protein